MEKVQLVSECYPEIWHYTTASGLKGILESQSLWGTNSRFLNDSDEMTGFFKTRFRSLVLKGVNLGLPSLLSTAAGNNLVEELGEKDKFPSTFAEQFTHLIKEVSSRNEIFLTSFSYAKNHADNEDGVLSQWRGYGTDGGYALIFDTKKIEILIDQENKKHYFGFYNFGNVDYHEPTDTDGSIFPETENWERVIVETVSKVISEKNLEKYAESLIEPVTNLVVRHKHRGFREESEIRLTICIPNQSLRNALAEEDGAKTDKEVLFYNRSGVLAPYVSFFGPQNAPLPIKRIIVGPHPDKSKRAHAVRLLLKQLNIEADVIESTIPYIGR